MQKLTPYKKRIEIGYLILTGLLMLWIVITSISCTTPKGYYGASKKEIKQIIKDRKYESKSSGTLIKPKKNHESN